MATAKRLIVGLGNPGPEYETTRHNVGFLVADALAEQAGIRMEHGRGNALYGEGRLRGRPFALAKPLTYMNRSGQAVRKLMGGLGLEPGDVLVVYDDLNLPPGTIRVRQGGSAGGHNGLQDVIDQLGTRDVPRLRVGIGNDFARGKQVDYVLSPFSDAEWPEVEQAIVKARDAAATFVRDGLITAMNRYNRS